MDEVFTLLEKISSVGFPGLLMLILYGSYKGIWVWGEPCRAAIKKAEDATAMWQNMALQATGLAEKSTEFAKAVRPQ